MKTRLVLIWSCGVGVVLLLATVLFRWGKDAASMQENTAVARSSISVPVEPSGAAAKTDAVDESRLAVTRVEVSSASTGTISKVAPGIKPGLQEVAAADAILVKDQVPRMISEAASSGLAPLLQCIPENDLQQYGFASTEEFAGASLAPPFKVHTITPDKILGFDGNASLASLLSSTELWYFPITCAGQYRALLTVGNVDGKWSAVAIGSSGLARDLSRVAATWPASEGYAYKLIRIYQARSDFTVVFKDGKSSLIPLTSASMMMGLAKDPDGGPKPYDYKNIVQRLGPIVSRSLTGEPR